MKRFTDIVDAADKLPPDDQIALVEILQQRLVVQERQQIIAGVTEGREEFRSGELKPIAVGDIMDEIANES